MPKTKSFLRVVSEPGPLAALAVALALLVGIAGPASAQFFNFGNNFGNFGGPQRSPPRGGGGGWFGGDIFEPFQQQIPRRRQAPRQIPEDFSKAPPPEKRETVPARNVLVLGDAMADWLASGLEDAYAERPDMGVIRKHKTVSGLIKYQPKGDPPRGRLLKVRAPAPTRSLPTGAEGDLPHTDLGSPLSTNIAQH
jgi:hypothetical protein